MEVGPDESLAEMVGCAAAMFLLFIVAATLCVALWALVVS